MLFFGASFLRFTLFCREICFVAIYALLRGEKLSQKLYLWRKNDKYEVCASVCQSRNSPQYIERTIGVQAWFYILQQTFDTFDKHLTHFTKFDTLNTTLTVNICLSNTLHEEEEKLY